MAAFHAAAAQPFETVRNGCARTGRPAVGVMPAYFPLELIHAAGGYPVQLWGAAAAVERADAYLPPFCCSVARSLLELEMRGTANPLRAYVFTSLCDTLVNLHEIYRRLFPKPTFGFAIPAAADPAARRDLLAAALGEITAGLEGLTGLRPTPAALRDAARRFGRVRALQRELYGLRRLKPGLIAGRDFYAAIQAGFFLPVEDYEPLLERLVDGLRAQPAPAGRLPRLVLSGMVFAPLAAHGIFDGLRAHVVDDDFANGWRSAAKGDLAVEDGAAGIAAHLFGGPPCCCIYDPGRDRHAYLTAKVREAGADGVVFWPMRFCEPDAFDRPQLIAHLGREGIPTLVLEMEATAGAFEGARTRVEAFVEMIGGIGE